MYLPSLLLLLLLLLIPPLIHAEFEEDELDGLYRLEAGTDGEPRCGDLLRIRSSSIPIVAENMFLDDTQCSGGDLSLFLNPSSNVGLIGFFAINDDTGDFYAGQTSGLIQCGSKSFGTNTAFVFVEPDDDIQITWEKVLGPNSPLEEATQRSVFTFEEDTPYLIVSNRCLYVREAFGSQISTVAVSVCFPGDAHVQLEHVGRVPMSQVRTGQRVHVGDGLYSPIYAWTHRDANLASDWYVSIDVGLEAGLVTTPGHFVYASDRAVKAADVKVGDIMYGGNGERLTVRNVTSVKRKGLYNPQTLHGNIVIDGVLVSTYTTAIERGAAHALLAPVRAAFEALGLVGLVECIVDSVHSWQWL